MPLCPTCHSNIGSGSTDPNLRVQGVQGTDTEGNPVPAWTDDPLLTRRILNGGVYSGINKVRGVHVLELQSIRNQQEDTLGITQTVFSPIDPRGLVLRRHLIELRQSTERLLNASGSTLEEYFKLDSEGAEQTQNPVLAGLGVPVPQVEWIDVERGEPYVDLNGAVVTTFTLPDSTVQQAPTLPDRNKVRAVHIEDLRHPVPTGIPTALVSGGDSSSGAIAGGGTIDPDTGSKYYIGRAFDGLKAGTTFRRVQSA